MPCICGRVKVLPLVGSTWIGTCFQHCVLPDEEQGRVRDWVIARSTLLFLLRGLECIDVLEDSLNICVVVLHLIFGVQGRQLRAIHHRWIGGGTKAALE